MAHFARERTDGDWYRGLKVPQTVIRNIDEKTKKAVSGAGGSYSPSSAIVIGGAGIELQCNLKLATSATTFPAAGKNYIFGDDDYFQYETHLDRYLQNSALLFHVGGAIPREARCYWDSAAPTVAPTINTLRPLAFLRMPIRVANGARFAAINVYFKVGVSHASVPQYLPRARAVRIKADGTVEKLPSQTGTANLDGWISPTRPATGADWYDSGNTKTLTLSFDSVNGERVDRSLYDYAVEWYDEGGTGAFDNFTGTSAVEQGNYIMMIEVRAKRPDLRPA